jgi:LysM repeat protein/ABC-type branched-subunit amino acid transport system substrate-binding protein
MGIIIVTFNSMKKIAFIFLLVFAATSGFAQSCKNYHVVASGETLYRISRIYGLTIAEIQALNPGLVTTVKLGEHLCLPNSVKPIQSEGVEPYPAHEPIRAVENKKDSSRTSISSKKDSYAIALLLPFSTFRISADSLDERSAKLRSVSVNMYRGAMMAQNAMIKSGINATISIYDVGSSAESGAKAVEILEANDVDLVIGPLFKDALAEVAKWVDGRNSHLVVPIKISNKVLLLSDHMSKAYPGTNSQWYYLAGYARKEFPNAIVIGAYGKGKDEFSMAAAKSGYGNARSDSLIMFDVTDGAMKLNEFIKSQKSQVVVLDMNSDKKLSASVSSALTGLNVHIIGGENYVSDDKLKLEPAGFSKVSATKSVSLDYYNIDHLKWIAQYRKSYKAEPDEYAALMHDVILFYGTGLMMFGTDLNNHLNDIECPGLIFMGFDFFKTGPESGYENAYVNVVQKMNGRWGLKNNLK